jgi:hypothetical protein
VIPRGQYIGKLRGDPPKDEANHFIRCPAGDGWIDCRDNNPGTQGAEVVFTAGRPLVRRDVVHVQDLLNNIVNLAEHESANFFLPLGRREQNESRDHGANVDDNAAKFVRRAWLEWHGGCPFER